MANYEVVYNVTLLDDLHNYFPALLYDNGRFQNLTQLFHYVRNQMNTRFNLYSYGASLANAGQAGQAGQAQGQGQEHRQEHRRGNDVSRMERTVILTPPHGPINSPIEIPTISATSALRNLQSVETLLAFFNTGLNDTTSAARGILSQPGDIWTSFGEPVVVRPTPEVIAAATERIQGSALTENTICTVCQDSIINSDIVRRIRACNHSYHLICIDQWFRRSVFCPSCRHDVRNLGTPGQEVQHTQNTDADAHADADQEGHVTP
jgi:hypothetical protein